MNDPTSAFAAQAREYCSLIEEGTATSSWMFAQVCLIQLLRLYQLALHLPEAVPTNGDLHARIEDEAWSVVREIARRLARDYYWAVFEPLEQETPEAVAGSLPDDLADIWRDVKPGLTVIDAQTTSSMTDVVWEWRSSFETHWGAHAVSAIAALHALCFGPHADGNRHTLTAPG